MKPNKVALGIFTAVPFVSAIVLAVWAIRIATDIASRQTLGYEMQEEEIVAMLMGDFITIFIIALAVSLLSLVLTIYYIVLALKNDRIENNMKILWVVVLFIFSGIAKIIYYFVEVLPDKDSNLPDAATN